MTHQQPTSTTTVDEPADDDSLGPLVRIPAGEAHVTLTPIRQEPGELYARIEIVYPKTVLLVHASDLVAALATLAGAPLEREPHRLPRDQAVLLHELMIRLDERRRISRAYADALSADDGIGHRDAAGIAFGIAQ